MTAIEVERLRKRYGAKVAVDDVSFTVAEGEIFGLLGRNGAGKSSTVDCVAGLRAPDHGGSASRAWTRAGTGVNCGTCSASSCRKARCPAS
jgi:ABC-type multidrug transport system ATPase subunit